MTSKKLLEKVKEISEEIEKSDSTSTSEYISWAQTVARNVDEYNYLLDIKDNYERQVIIDNVNLFYDIQSVLNTSSPHLNELSIEDVLNYNYKNRIYWVLYYEGYVYGGSRIENLPNDAELRAFVRLHFDPQARKLTGSSMDKVVSWIREGYTLDNIVLALNHYYDHRKIYQDGHVNLENLDCETFQYLKQSFKLYRGCHMLLMNLTEKNRIEITRDQTIYDHFLNFARFYIKFNPTLFGEQFEAFKFALTKEVAYENRIIDFIYYLLNSFQGFDYDREVKRVTNDAKIDNKIKIIKSEFDFFIFQTLDYQTMKKYSSPHWCINRNIEQYNSYVSNEDDFYIILVRDPKSAYNYRSGVTFNRNNRTIKHSHNQMDNKNIDYVEKYSLYFKPRAWYDIFKKRNRHDDEIRQDGVVELAPQVAITLEEEAKESCQIILPRF